MSEFIQVTVLRLKLRSARHLFIYTYIKKNEKINFSDVGNRVQNKFVENKLEIQTLKIKIP